jgi:hypothetical protein
MRILILLASFWFAVFAPVSAEAAAQDCQQIRAQADAALRTQDESTMQARVLRAKREDARALSFGFARNMPEMNLSNYRQAVIQLRAHPQINENSERGYSLRTHLLILDALGDALAGQEVLGIFGLDQSRQQNALTRMMDMLDAAAAAKDKEATDFTINYISLLPMLAQCEQGQAYVPVPLHIGTAHGPGRHLWRGCVSVRRRRVLQRRARQLRRGGAASVVGVISLL